MIGVVAMPIPANSWHSRHFDISCQIGVIPIDNIILLPDLLQVFHGVVKLVMTVKLVKEMSSQHTSELCIFQNIL